MLPKANVLNNELRVNLFSSVVPLSLGLTRLAAFSQAVIST